ncbi:MAG: curlin [Pseudomonadota bacterium]
MKRTSIISAIIVAATAFAAPASANDVFIDQFGFGNSAGGGQNGVGNDLVILQEGVNSTSIITQDGFGNLAGSGQSGSNHYSETNQLGALNESTTIQTGNGCGASSNQNGVGNTVAIIQNCP